MRNKKAGLIINFSVVLLIALILLEMGINILLSHSGILSGLYKYPYNNPFREYYEFSDRKSIQYLPECAQYDKELAYTLRPGRCRFRNREYDIDVRINSAGLRDDEASLDSPEIIVLGDSHALGWGVEQEQTFADIIEKKTGMKVLNAAMSSYGTVRELKILERINTHNVKHLIIQYCDNDILENREYYKNDNVLPIMSKEKYDETVARHLKDVKYYPGKHSFYMLKNLLFQVISLFTDHAIAGEIHRDAEEVELFFNALANSPVDLEGMNIIVFEVNGYAGNNSDFINSLSGFLSAHVYPELMLRVKPVDFSQDLKPDKYFSLDEHMTAEGHYHIANTLADILMQDPG